MPPAVASPPRIKVAGSVLPDRVNDALLDIDVQLSVQEPNRATVRFQDVEYARLSSSDYSKVKVGVPIVVSLSEGTAVATEVFSGEITGVEFEQSPGGSSSVIVVDAHDLGHRLAATGEPTTFLEQTTEQVVRQIAARHQLQPKFSGSGAAGQTHAYLVQTSSDHALLDQLARQLGFRWWTTGSELHFGERERPPGRPQSYEYGVDLYGFSAGYDATGTVTKVSVTGWDTVGTEDIVGAADPPTGSALDTALGSTAPLVTEQHRAALSEIARPLSLAEQPTTSQNEAEALATSVQRELLGDGLHMTASVIGDPTLVPGTWVELKGLGDKLSGKYYLTGVRHRFGPRQDLVTEMESRQRRPEPPPWEPDLRPPGAGAWSVRGPVPGVVTDVQDPNDLGRVKVKFNSLGGTITSTWARVVAPGAGVGRGLDLRPRVEDEVLVAFAHGDPRQSYVLGGLWSESHAHHDAANTTEDGVPRDSLRSEAGGLLTFHKHGEGTGHRDHEHLAAWNSASPELEGAVSIRSKDKAGVIVGDKVVIASDEKDIVLTNGKATITLMADGTIMLEGEKLEITSKATANLEAQGDVEIKAANATLKAQSKVTLDGMSAEVKGMSGVTIKSMKVGMGP